MKNIIFILAIIGFASCSKSDDARLSISNSQWYLTKNVYGGGEVNLKIIGSTNGNKVMIITSGDGVSSWQKIEQNSDNNFEADIVIGFFATAIPGGEFEMSTKVIAYKGTDSLFISLNSGKLKF
jgi:ABC-type thiamine transport system substrate-binding protein